MFFVTTKGDGEDLLMYLLIGILMGALCGGIPLAVGLIRGNKSMAWTGFGVSILLGLACSPFPVALLPAIIFTIIVAITEPIEKRKKRRGPKRTRRDRADDFLDDDFGPKRRRDADAAGDRRRRRRYEDEDEEDDYDDRPRRRRRDD
jgi:hypothetical protein